MNANDSLNITEMPDKHVTSNVIVIGAGISGLTVANEFQLSKHDVCVFEKSRGTGGRLGSKRLSIETDIELAGNSVTESRDINAVFDLGASSFSAQTGEFKRFLQELELQNVVAKIIDAKDRYVATPRNSMLTRHLSQNIDVVFSKKVTRIEYKDNKWFLFGESQADKRQPQISHKATSKHIGSEFSSENVIACCNHLVLSAPAEQTQHLLPSDHAANAWLNNIYSDPVFVSSIILPPEVMSHEDLTKLQKYSNKIIKNIFIEHAKPGRQVNNYQIVKLTTTVGWAKQHLNETLLEIEGRLKSAFNDLLSSLKIAQLSSVNQYTHRWLYSQYSNLIDNTKGYLSFSDNLHIVGDYFDVQSQGVENECQGNQVPQKIEGVERSYISAQRLVSHLMDSDLLNDVNHDKFSSQLLCSQSNKS